MRLRACILSLDYSRSPKFVGVWRFVRLRDRAILSRVDNGERALLA